MSLRRKSTSPQREIDVLHEHIERLTHQMRMITQAGPSHLQADAWQFAIAPFPWETIMNWPGGHRLAWPEDTMVYWHPGRTDPITGEVVPEGWYAVGGPTVDRLKVFDDRANNRVRDDARKWPITEDCNAMKVIRLHAYNTTAGSGVTTVRVRNVTRGVTISSTDITIDSGEYSSYFSGSPYAINEGGDPTDPNNKVYTGNRFHIDVLAVGTGSKGLGVDVTFA